MKHGTGTSRRRHAQRWGKGYFFLPVVYLQFQLKGVGRKPDQAGQQTVRFCLPEALGPVLRSFWSMLRNGALH